MRYRLVILVFSTIMSIGSSMAQEHYDELFQMGNAAYKAGAYDSAKSLYSEILNSGVESFELYYNLGNSYFKDGNVPAAILYFERAARLNRNDDDLQHNLEVVRSFTTDKIEPLESLAITNWWGDIAILLNHDTWAWFCIIILAISCIGWGLYVLALNRSIKQLGFFAGLIGVFLAITTAALGFKSMAVFDQSFGIVFSSSVNVKSEPDLNSTVQFVVHEGLKAEILETEEEWVRIKLADGNSGWISSQSIERI